MNEQDGFTSVKLQFLCGQIWLKGLINWHDFAGGAALQAVRVPPSPLGWYFDLLLNEYIFGRL